MFLSLATRGMEGITKRQRNLGAVHVERDPAQIFDRPRSSYRHVQAERFEHRLCPVEQPSIAFCIGARVGIGVWRRCRDR